MLVIRGEDNTCAPILCSRTEIDTTRVHSKADYDEMGGEENRTLKADIC